MDKIERDQFIKNVAYWTQEIKKTPVDLDTVVKGNCLVSDRGLCYQVVRNNKKTLSVNMLVVSYKACMRLYGKVDRAEKLDKDTNTKYYLVTRDDLVLSYRAYKLQREIDRERLPELVVWANQYIKTENDLLAAYTAKYNLVKECTCITHQESHLVYDQKWWIGHNADILKSGGNLAEHAFSKEEYKRLKELEYYLDIEERKLDRN